MSISKGPCRIQKAKAATTVEHNGVKKRRSLRLAKKQERRRFSINFTSVQAYPCTTTPKYETGAEISALIEGSASEYAETESEASAHERDDSELHMDNLHYRSAHEAVRHLSIDSRYESGNQDCESDGFIVDDDDDLVYDADADGSDSKSEITLRSPESPIGSKFGSTTDIQQSNHEDKKTLDVAREERRNSLRSLFSISTNSSDGLFVTDRNDLPTQILEEVPTTDVLEEITDAVCRFKRRCNRNSPTIRILLTSAHLDDEEVRDILEDAKKLGLVSAHLTEGGGLICNIGYSF